MSTIQDTKTSFITAAREDTTFVVNACAIIGFCFAMTILSAAIVELEHDDTVKIIVAEFAMFAFAAATLASGISFVKDITRKH